MHISFRTRRTAALMAASALGLSGLVLGVLGVASAATDPLYDFTFSTDPGDDADQPVAAGGNLDIPAGYCSIEWSVVGASGGDADQGGLEGEELSGVTALDRSQTTFTLFPGLQGQSGANGGAGGTNGRSGDAGSGGANDGAGDVAGGGGAASTVVKGGAAYLSATGGDGSDSPLGGAGGNGGGSETLQTGVTGNGTSYGDGVISGTVVACPGAPDVKWVSGGDHSLDFQLWTTSMPDGVDATGVQYSLDGGSWTDVTTTSDPTHFQFEGSIPGLNTAQDYAVRFRFTTTGALGNASDAVTAAPLLPAPTNVTAVVGTSSITVTWQAPTGTTATIGGYTATASSVADRGQQAGNEPPSCDAMGASTLSCTIIVPAGAAYDVRVAANGATQRGLYSAPVTTGTVPAPSAPATVPTGSGALSTPSGAPSGLAQGSSVTLTGSGYAPNSTVSVYIYSTPTLLGTVVTNGAGSFSKAFTIPTALAPGAHHLVSAGLDPSGNARYLTSAVTVAQATGSLAWTGFETLPVLGAGLLTVVLGLGLMVVARRRRTA